MDSHVGAARVLDVDAHQDLRGVLRYRLLFELGWSLFFAGSLYLGWNSLGILLLIVHLFLDGRAISRMVKTSLENFPVAINLKRVRIPLRYIFVTLGCASLVSSLMAVEPGRAAAALLGMLLSMAFGLVFGLAYQVQQPGWFIPYFLPAVLGGAVHVAWALWQAFQIGSLQGARVATVSGPNYTGTMMLLVLIIGWSWFVSQRAYLRWLSLPYTFAAATALVFTYSRGSWLGGVAFALAALLPAWQRPVSRRYGVLVLVGLVSFGVLVVSVVPGAAERATSFLTLLNDGRVGIWQASWEMFLDHFWFGVGPANFEHYWDTYNRGRVPEHIDFSHNTWLQVLTETGIIGGVLFALIIGRILLAVWRLRKTSDWPVWILASGVVALLVRDLTDAAIFNINTSFLFWWMAGTVLAAEQMQQRQRQTVS